MKQFISLSILSLVLCFSATNNLHAFPGWMGVYGEHARHSGGNPGTFTVLMNQDYWGLHAEVGISINGGAWTNHTLNYTGNIDGNSKWQATLGKAFPEGAEIQFYFHGWDNWGGNIWDSNGGGNYAFTANPSEIYWAGNVTQSPESDIDFGQNVELSIQSWPIGGAQQGAVVFTDDGGVSWRAVEMGYAGLFGGNDLWGVNMGSFYWGTQVQYSIQLWDGAGQSHWENNGGADYFFQVNHLDLDNVREQQRDEDSDGLKNIEEQALGSDFFARDTDGDGADDLLESAGLGTSVTVAQGHAFTDRLNINVTQPSEKIGVWNVVGSRIESDFDTSRGVLEYDVNVAQGDVYRLELITSGIDSASIVEVRVDGILAGRIDLPQSEGVSASSHLLLPYLSAGSHTLTLHWDNTFGWNRLALEKAALQSLAGADSNGDGIKDWVLGVLSKKNTASLLPEQSLVSPAFIEGQAFHGAESVSINGGAIQAKASSKGWYANVPLNEASATSVTVSFENGGLANAGEITWKPFNVLLENDITIRKGDALLLMADDLSGASGNASIAINGANTYNLAQGQGTAHSFNTAGNYVVSASLTYGYTTIQESVAVKVLDYNLPDATAICRLGVARDWACPTLPEGVSLISDPGLYLEDAGFAPNGDLQFKLHTDHYAPRTIDARIGGENGAILDTTEVEGVQVFGSNYTYQRRIEILPDGSDLLEVGIVMAPLLPESDDVTVKVKTLAAGVTFEDGSISKTFTASDFDVTGKKNIRLIRPAKTVTAACHSFEVFQGGVKISQ